MNKLKFGYTIKKLIEKFELIVLLQYVCAHIHFFNSQSLQVNNQYTSNVIDERNHTIVIIK